MGLNPFEVLNFFSGFFSPIAKIGGLTVRIMAPGGVLRYISDGDVQMRRNS